MGIETITILPLEEIRVIKQIVIVTDYANNKEFPIGYILYERHLTNSYKFKEVPESEKDFDYYFNYPNEAVYPKDRLDDIIFQAVRNTFPKSVTRNYNVIFNIDMDRVKTLQNRQVVKNEMTFTPDCSQVDIYNLSRQSFSGLRKEIKIYNDFRLDDIKYLAFNGYYNLKDKQILSDLDQITFI
jgi:hypothetical protein